MQVKENPARPKARQFVTFFSEGNRKKFNRVSLKTQKFDGQLPPLSRTRAKSLRKLLKQLRALTEPQRQRAARKLSRGLKSLTNGRLIWRPNNLVSRKKTTR